MTPQNQIHTVRIQDVEFHQPLPDAYKLIRLDDIGEIIHNLHIIPHLSTRQLTDRQVMLSRQKKRYHLYDAANLEHPLWNPPPSAAQAAYPSYDADGRPLPQSAPDPAAHEVTIQDIRFYDLPPELYEHIVKSNNAMNRIAAVIAICIALPFFGFLIMALGREMLEYWFITLPVVAVITLLCIIVARNEK